MKSKIFPINQILKEYSNKIKAKQSNFSYSRSVNECRTVLSHSLGINKNELIRIENGSINENQFERFKSMIDQFLLNDKPIEYICNSADFYSLQFKVEENVTLIPRNDTEIVNFLLKFFFFFDFFFNLIFFSMNRLLKPF